MPGLVEISPPLGTGFPTGVKSDGWLGLMENAETVLEPAYNIQFRILCIKILRNGTNVDHGKNFGIRGGFDRSLRKQRVGPVWTGDTVGPLTASGYGICKGLYLHQMRDFSILFSNILTNLPSLPIFMAMTKFPEGSLVMTRQPTIYQIHQYYTQMISQ
jgi:hypothetical protein